MEEQKTIINKDKNIGANTKLNGLINLINYMDINDQDNTTRNENISFENYGEDKLGKYSEKDKYDDESDNESFSDNILNEKDKGISNFSKNALNNTDKSEFDMDFSNANISN